MWAYLLKVYRVQLAVAAVFLALGTWGGVTTWRLHRAQRRIFDLETASKLLLAQQRESLAVAKAEIARIDSETAKRLEKASATLPKTDDPEELLKWLREMKK